MLLLLELNIAPDEEVPKFLGGDVVNLLPAPFLPLLLPPLETCAVVTPILSTLGKF